MSSYVYLNTYNVKWRTYVRESWCLSMILFFNWIKPHLGLLSYSCVHDHILAEKKGITLFPTIHFPLVLLEISSPERVMQVLQDHAAKTVMLAPSHPAFVASQSSHQCNYDSIWEDIYSNINLYQVQQEEITNVPLCSMYHLCVRLRNLLW